MSNRIASALGYVTLVGVLALLVLPIAAVATKGRLAARADQALGAQNSQVRQFLRDSG